MTRKRIRIKKLANDVQNSCLLDIETKFSWEKFLRIMQVPSKFHYVRSVGSGKNTRYEYDNDLIDALKTFQIDFLYGNDAPRGGQLGKFVELTSKGKCKRTNLVKAVLNPLSLEKKREKYIVRLNVMSKLY